MGHDQVALGALRLLNIDPSASMGALAAAAGISRATLHRHFATREDLIGHLGRMSLDSWRDALDEAKIDQAAASSDAAQCSEALDALCGQLIRDVEEYGFTFTEHSLHSDDEITEASEKLQARESAFYAAAQAAGVLRIDLPTTWISHTVFGLLIGLREALRRGDIATSDAQRLLRETLRSGIAAY